MSFFRRKHEEKKVNTVTEVRREERLNLVQETPKKDEVIFDNPQKRKQYVQNCCEQIVEAGKKVEEIKTEYQIVNAYLSDIQIISRLPDLQREELVKQAKRVIVFQNDRNEYSKKSQDLSYKQFAYFKDHEDDIQDTIKSMKEDEDYCRSVRTDMKYLEGEKLGLRMEKHELNNRLESLGKIAKVAIFSIVVLMFFVLVYSLSTKNSIDFMLYAVVAAAIIMAAVIFILHQRTLYDIRYTDAKINRAISLLNKVKLKYVNVAARLEYEYEKHEVKSTMQFTKAWNIYLQENKRKQVYQKTSDKLVDAENRFVSLLKEYKVKDADIWIAQAYIIVDKSELLILENKIQKRRAKVKEAIDYNMDVIDNSKKSIKQLIDNNKKHAKEIMDIVDKYE